MRSVILVLFLLCTSTIAFCQSQHAQRVDAVDQWANVIRRTRTSRVMWQVVALLEDTREKVNAVTDPVRDKNFRWALRQLDTTASNKARGLGAMEKLEAVGRGAIAARQRQLLEHVTEQSLQIAQNTVRQYS